MTAASVFHRYTNLAATIHLLKTKNITLLNPTTWDDRNDAYFMAEYKRLKNAKAVLTLCFAGGRETYHHWRVFANGIDGIRVTFDKEKLLTALDGDSRIKHGYVNYKLIKNVNKLNAEELPFLKRVPFVDESEYQAVYADRREAEEYVNYEIEIRWIRRITVSPWMPAPLSRSVIRVLKSIEACSSLSIRRSGLIDTDAWKALTKRVR